MIKAGIKYKGRYGLPKCVDCNKQLSRKDAKRCHFCANSNSKNGMFGKKRPDVVKRNKETDMSGSNNSNWQGGLSLEGYPFKFNDTLKLKVRTRDDFTCQICGMLEEEHLIVVGHSLHVHHIDYDKENNELYNLITLCNGCNVRANYNRNYWLDYFKSKVNY